MRHAFQGFYAPTKDDFSKLWGEATFVIDSSTLLNLYRYPKSASTALLASFKKVQGRLWLPHQVGLEYQENRLTVIAGQEHKFGDVRKTADKVLGTLNKDIDDLQLKTRHSLISPEAFVNAVAKAVTDFKKYLDEVAKEQDGVTSHDKLRDEIDALFTNRVGPPPKDQAELEEIYKRGKDRYEHEVPPGYMDLKKEGSHTFGTLRYERKFGDLVLWEQLIKEANLRDLKYLIFITDDEKEDWWWIVKSNGPKTQGPRPELIEELRQRSSVELFYMYSSEQFLKYANEYLGTIVEERTIDVVRALSRSKRTISRNGAQANQNHLANSEITSDQLFDLAVQFSVMARAAETQRLALPPESQEAQDLANARRFLTNASSQLLAPALNATLDGLAPHYDTMFSVVRDLNQKVAAQNKIAKILLLVSSALSIAAAVQTGYPSAVLDAVREARTTLS